MIKKLIVAIVLMAVLCTMAGARVPQIGDKVMTSCKCGKRLCQIHRKYYRY